MANEYLKPQIPLKDLNSENYFYPLTTSDQIFLSDTTTRLNSLLDHTNFTASRAIYYNGTKLLSSNNIFLNDNQIAINKTSITSGYNFEVNGNSLFDGLIKASSFFGALAEEELDKTDIRTWCDTATNIHKSSYQGDMVLKRFFSQDEAATTYNLPCVDSHMMIFSIGGINWTRILALDMRSPTLFIGGKNNGNWQTWTQLITDNTAQTITAEKTFTTDITFKTADLGIIQSYYNGTKYNILRHHNNGNVSLSAESVGLYLGYQNTTFINFLNGRARLQDGCLHLHPNNGNYREGIRIHAQGSWSDIVLGGNDLTGDTGTSANTWFIGNNNGTFNIVRNGSSTGTAYFRCVNNKWYANTTSGNEQLNVGGWVGTVGNVGWYNITHGGGWYMSDNIWIRTYGNKSVYQNSGKIRTDGELWSKYIRIVDNWIGVYENIDNTTKRFGYMQIDRSNNGLFRFVKENGGNFYFNTLVRIDGDLHVGNNSTVGHIICGTYKDTAHGEHQIQVNSGAGRWYLYSQASATGTRGIYGHNNAGTGVSVLYMNQDNYLRAGTRLYGAVWNDYAEFRKGQMDNLKPGQVVTEIGNGEMKLANKKLQKGCKILSDTYGFALGETKECKLPIAVAGRVLVYCDTIKEELEPGDCLCANYTGNTIKMTQEEIIKYPDRIIGIVSEIPNYNIWHSLDPDNPDVLKEDIKVDGRIWVYVR